MFWEYFQLTAMLKRLALYESLDERMNELTTVATFLLRLNHVLSCKITMSWSEDIMCVRVRLHVCVCVCNCLRVGVRGNFCKKMSQIGKVGVCLPLTQTGTHTSTHTQYESESRTQRVPQPVVWLNLLNLPTGLHVISGWRDNHTQGWHVQTLNCKTHKPTNLKFGGRACLHAWMHTNSVYSTLLTHR